MTTTPKGTIHTVFRQTVDALRTQASGIADAAVFGNTRPWQTPAITGDWDGGLFNIVGMAAAFNREAIEANHAEVVGDASNPGTVGDVVSLKLQSDYVASVERGFRARHASPIRCAAHAAARRVGHGSTVGIFGDGSGALKLATDALSLGQSTPQGL